MHRIAGIASTEIEPRADFANMSTKQKVEAAPLETRHVFLDTEVYNKLKHNAANRALSILAKHIDEHRLVLHVTDITLLEIKRQLAEEVEQTRAALGRIDKDLTRWRHSDGGITPIPVVGDQTAEHLFGSIDDFIRGRCRAKLHDAMSHSAHDVFADYFARRPPFDKGEKEFPDSFMVKTLDTWCASEGERMYVVTKDGAMLRYAEASPNLLPLATIEDLLASASLSAEPDGDAEAIADELLNSPAFDHYLESAITSHVDDLVVDYSGDLPEGEVNSVRFDGAIQSMDYHIVAMSRTRLGLVIKVDTEIVATVGYEDRDLAMYDREDGVWLGGEWESTEVANSIPLEMFVELDVGTGGIVTSELLRTEYSIY